MRRDYTIPQGDLHRLKHSSTVLKGNFLDDPVDRELYVWTPPGWTKSERLPLLVDLKGYWSSGLAHANWQIFSENVVERLDRLTFEGMERVIVAFPDCFTKLYGNQYINSAGTGRYADYLCDEIVPFVEEAFNCGGEGRRGLFGKSSGGYGAAWHALCRSDFWAVASMNSADMGFETAFYPELLTITEQLAPHDYSIERYFHYIEAQPKIGDKDIVCITYVAQGAFYDPDLTQFRAMRLPMDPFTGELIPERWANWMAHDPVVMLDDRLHEIRKLKAIWMDCGSRDQYKQHFGMRRFHLKLASAGIDHVYEEFDDTHSDIDYRMDNFIPFLAKALSE